jgi:hypothetical protein
MTRPIATGLLAATMSLATGESMARMEAAAPSGPAGRLDLVVAHDPARNPNWVELYLALPAEDLERVLGAEPGLLGDAQGRVDLAEFKTGTFDLADRIFAAVTARADAAPLHLEAMSLMLHPEEAPLPMRTPMDGEIAMSVCGVPIPDVPPSLGELTAYVGLIAQTDGPVGSLELVFPGPEAAGRVAQVAVHGQGGAVRNTAPALDGQGHLSLRLTPQPQPRLWRVIGALGALAGLAGLAWWIRAARSRPRPLRG